MNSFRVKNLTVLVSCFLLPSGVLMKTKNANVSGNRTLLEIMYILHVITCGLVLENWYKNRIISKYFFVPRYKSDKQKITLNYE